MASGLLESIDRSTQLAGHNRLALLLFRLDERQIFGINVFKVQEVIPRPALSWMPASHELVRGVAEIRGRMVPVIDLNKAIGAEPDDRAAHVIVTEYNRSIQGFLVRAVERIIHVDVANVLPPPGGAGEGGYLTAVMRHNDEMVEIIDVEKVLADVVGEPPALATRLIEQASALNRLGRVLVADPRSEFAFVTEEGGRESTEWHYRFEPTEGGTRVVESYVVQWIPLWARIVDVPTNRARELRDGMDHTLGQLKTTAEGASAPEAAS